MRPRCRRDGVRSYPTWVFADGTVVQGLQSPEVLASISGCREPASSR
jgi:predicted DsbA family dithiol-disulfide isomerase